MHTHVQWLKQSLGCLCTGPPLLAPEQVVFDATSIYRWPVHAPSKYAPPPGAPGSEGAGGPAAPEHCGLPHCLDRACSRGPQAR